jgi:copper chaperone
MVAAGHQHDDRGVHTRAAQAAQVIPPITSSTSAVAWTAPASVSATATATTSRIDETKLTTVHSRSIAVADMTSDHCARAVQAEIGELPGVTGVDVDVAGGTVRVTGDPLPGDVPLREAVEEAGYQFAE